MKDVFVCDRAVCLTQVRAEDKNILVDGPKAV